MTTGMNILIAVLSGAAALTVLVMMVRTGKPVRRAATSLVEGFCAMAAVDVAGIFTGVSLGFSWFTAAVCGVFGIPGVISLLIMRALAL